MKLLAEAASISSVSSEKSQIVLRYPPLPEGVNNRSFPNLGHGLRTGKNAIWIPASTPDWRERLIGFCSCWWRTRPCRWYLRRPRKGFAGRDMSAFFVRDQEGKASAQ